MSDEAPLTPSDIPEYETNERDEAAALRRIIKAHGKGKDPKPKDVTTLEKFRPTAADKIEIPISTTIDDLTGSDPLLQQQAWEIIEPLLPTAGPEMTSKHTPDPSHITWLVKGWMPDATLSVLTGAGGAGKSRIALQLAVAVATGQPRFLTVENTNRHPNSKAPDDYVTDSGPVVFAAWETRHIAFANRLAAICGPIGSIRNEQIKLINDAKTLHYTNMRPHGGLWGSPRGALSDTAGELLPGGKALLSAAARLKPRLLIIDPVAAAYAGNENDRTMVRAFLSHLDQWADDNICAVLLIAHPPKSAHAQSGSTDWRNGVQAVWDLTTDKNDEDKRILRMDKLNEGPIPDQFILTYQNGRFIGEADTQESETANRYE